MTLRSFHWLSSVHQFLCFCLNGGSTIELCIDRKKTKKIDALKSLSFIQAVLSMVIF